MFQIHRTFSLVRRARTRCFPPELVCAVCFVYMYKLTAYCLQEEEDSDDEDDDDEDKDKEGKEDNNNKDKDKQREDDNGAKEREDGRVPPQPCTPPAVSIQNMYMCMYMF